MVEDRGKRRPRSTTVPAKQLPTKFLRVRRACDNCRLRKSKCDGRVPCGFCISHDFECGYHSTRPKRLLDAKYIQSLERDIARLKLALEAADAKRSEEPSEKSPSSATEGSPMVLVVDSKAFEDERMLLETMVDATGSLNIDESGNCDYNGNSSGLVMIRRIRERCDAFLEGFARPQAEPLKSTPYHSFTTPASSPSSASNYRDRPTLPAKEIGMHYVSTVFDVAFPLLQFLHRPTFNDHFERFYASRVSPDFEDPKFEALLYEIFALGELFTPSSQFEARLVEAPPLAELYFRAGRDLVNITDVCDLTSLQALLCMVMYLQSSGMLPTSYSYISLTMAACTRMGLHRADTSSKFNPVDREVRKRIFWCIRTLESYVMMILGLPSILSDEDLDQELPEQVDDKCITEEGLIRLDSYSSCPMTVVNAHTKLLVIMAKVKRFVLGKGNGEFGSSKPHYRVDYARIVEIENELELWFSQLPKDFDFPQPIPLDTIRAQLLLRGVYAHVQMVLYRPFLHHFAKSRTDPEFDLRAFACASACINAAMQIVWLDEALESKGLMEAPSRFLLFTTLQATVCLLMFVLSNRGEDTAEECLNGARRGYAILSKFTHSNRTAKDYVECLDPLFERISLAQNPPSTSTHTAPPQIQRSLLAGQASENNPDRVLFNDVFLVSPPIPPSTATARVSHECDDTAGDRLESYLQATAYTPGNPFDQFASDYLSHSGRAVNHGLF